MRSHAIRKGGRKQQKSCAQRHVCQRQAIQSCRRSAQATNNYPGCKQRRPGAQAAEPRLAGAEQASGLFRGAEVAAMRKVREKRASTAKPEKH